MRSSKFKVAAIAVLLSVGFCFAESETVDSFYYDGSKIIWVNPEPAKIRRFSLLTDGETVDSFYYDGSKTIWVNSRPAKIRRFSLLTDFGRSFGLGDYGISTLDVSILFGAAINQHFFLYLGFGQMISDVGKTNGIKYYENDGEKKVFKKVIENEKGLPKNDILYNDFDWLIAMFLRPRFYLSKKNISPFIDADIGILGFSESSFYFNPSVGIEVSRYSGSLRKMGLIFISVGYEIRAAQYKKLLIGTDKWNLNNFIGTYESGGTVKRPNSAISLKFGYGFKTVFQFPK
ncbi:MAG: hypothetical protein FWF51_12675 [Chitinivibrionia bacterium]|nr:hypothetical protein [Chitinivibrionia bacterium]